MKWMAMDGMDKMAAGVLVAGGLYSRVANIDWWSPFYV